MTMFQRSRLLAAVLAGFVIVACSPMKEPAEAALADANAALQKVAPDGLKYAPTEYATVNEQVATMKAAFDKQDYQTVLNMVRKLAPNLKLLAGTIANRKSEAVIALKEQWASMSRDVPKSFSAVETRIAELSKTRKLPKGVSKDALAGAGAAVDAAKQGWSDAQSARTSGNVEDAVTKGKAAEAKLSELMTSLGMNSPRAAAK
jgi:hypothetical protein